MPSVRRDGRRPFRGDEELDGELGSGGGGSHLPLQLQLPLQLPLAIPFPSSIRPSSIPADNYNLDPLSSPLTYHFYSNANSQPFPLARLGSDERRHGHAGQGHGLNSGYAFFRGSQASGGHYSRHRHKQLALSNQNQIHNSNQSPSPTDPIITRRYSSGPNSSVNNRVLDETASAVVNDLLYYGQHSGMTAGGPHSSDIHHRHSTAGGVPRGSIRAGNQHPSAALCRCGSGGALPPPPSSPPPGSHYGLGGGHHPSFRAAQSLPSTPNACRRPLSPPLHNLVLPPLPRPFGLDLGSATNGGIRPVLGFGDIAPPQILHAAPVNHSALPSSDGCYFGPASNMPGDCGPGPMSDSAAVLGNEDLSGNGNGNGATRARAFQQQWAAQRRTIGYRTTSQPLMKLSTLVIVLIAIIIIGFIVLSPLLHYLT